MELLEREASLQALQTVLAEATAGNGRIALVSGEAGIGKTSLVEQFAAKCPKSAQQYWGACDSLFTPRPLDPIYDMAHKAWPELLSLLQQGAEWLAIARTFLSTLENSKQSSLVIIEDVHWADEATLDLIKFLGRRIRATPTLMIITYRDDELEPHHPLRIVLGDLATSKILRRIPLRPLSIIGVQQLAKAKEVDIAALHQQTKGNPFFVTELLANEGETIPTTVRDAIMARAARLSPAGRATLEAAAIIGARVEPGLLAQVADDKAAAAEECIATGMLRTDGEALAFRHELTRQAVLEAISPPRKLLLHQQVLAAMQATPLHQQHLARLAHHAHAANDFEAVLKYAPLAAEQARAAEAHREAAAQYGRALHYADHLPVTERAALLEAYALACNIVERVPDCIAARQDAIAIWQEVGNQLKVGHNLSLLVVVYFRVGKTAVAEQTSREAIELLEGLPPSRELGHAYRTQAGLRMLHRDMAEALIWAEKAVALAEQFNDTETLAAVYNTIGSALLLSDYEEGCRYLEKSLAIAQANNMPMYVANAFTNLGSGSGELYQIHRADRYLAQGVAYALEREQDGAWLYMTAWRALTKLYLGQWDEAADLATAVLQTPGVSATTQIMALLALGRLRTRRGDPGIWEALDEALSLADKTQTLQRIAPVRIARAEAAWLASKPQHAQAEAEAAYRLAVDKKHPWFTGELAFWLWRAGQSVTLPSWTAVPFAQQITGEWQAAAANWKERGCPYEQAAALADGDEASQFAALEIFEQLGAAPAADKLRQKLQAAGVRGIPRGPRPTTRENPFGLTSREMDVLELLAEGLSNTMIAQRLTISPRTVEHHVSAILGKLAVESRMAAAAIVRQHNLFAE
ncbi:ATP-binding protein [Candidatus Leptofilum sp.]|uniref:ATP-binding protein n=1 Tax=Candidatus Leptofilum sp. TaxID=3241576 RepID=UPI003B5B98C6